VGLIHAEASAGRTILVRDRVCAECEKGVLLMAKPYQPPRLTDYGPVASLTLGSSTMAEDVMGSMINDQKAT